MLALGSVAAWRCWRLATGGLARASAVALIVAYLAAFLLVLTR